ncbi:MAG: VCBS repeat-containing protein [Pirellulales bacterium]
MSCRVHSGAALAVLTMFAAAAHGQSQFNFRQQEIENQLGVGYAVSLVDVNADKKLDIVVVDTNRVLWYENPTWKRRVMIEDQTKRDNVCIAAYDIDGDGQVDFALGADWRPNDTVNSGTIQWLRRGKSLDEKWMVYPIGTEPTVHRMRFADFDGDGRGELIVSPLHGRGNRGPRYEGAGVRTLRYKIPADPTRQENWKAEVINDEVHVSHNLWPTDLNRDGKLDLLIASFEGVSLVEQAGEGTWTRTLIGSGNQETKPNRGASEIKHGRLREKSDYLATIEPFHGFQVVVYTPPDSSGENATEKLWNRHVLDDQLAWGHAVWCANLDADSDEELIIGVRDQKSAEHRRGVRIYDPGSDRGWERHLIDPGGVAVEDLVAADLDGDGDIDIVAAGRATKNVRIYWNDAK